LSHYFVPNWVMMIAITVELIADDSKPVNQALDHRAFSSSRIRISWSATARMSAFISAKS
jgi:hypothetical protein